MARNNSEQEPTVDGISDELLEVIRVDARAGEWSSEDGHVKFSDLSDKNQRLYQDWSYEEKQAFFRAYKAWLKSKSP